MNRKVKRKPWHRIKRPDYWNTVETEHLRLEPQSWWSALMLERRLVDDPEARIKMGGSGKLRSSLQILRRYRGPNGCSRHTHAIIDKATGEMIGFHKIGLHNYRKATLTIVMLKRDKSVRGFAKEARTALLRHFVNLAGVELFLGEVNTRNFASVQLYNQLGFERSGILHNLGYDAENERVLHSFVFELHGQALVGFMERTTPPGAEQIEPKRDSK